MSIEGRPTPSPELTPRAISDKLIEKLGTLDIPFTFRTANNSIYVSDRKLQTARYKLAANSFQPPSTMTVYLDGKYLEYSAMKASGDVKDGEYLANTYLNKEGILILNDPELLRTKKASVRTFSDIPEDLPVDAVKQALCIVIFDPVAKKVIRKTPVSLMPKIGFHPIEFWGKRDARGYDKHIGNKIENIFVTNRMDADETRAAIETLAEISIENKKNQPPPTTLEDLDKFL